jgi:hypothetical protein
MQSRNPIVPTIANPFGIDKFAKELQTTFADITLGVSWLDYIYGIVRFGKNDKGNNVPMSYIGKRDYDILNINDTCKAFSYLQLNDPQTIIQDVQNIQLTRYNLDLVVLANLNLIDNTPDYDYHFEQLLQQQVIRSLKFMKETEVLQIFNQNIATVFNRWSSNVIPANWFEYPFTAFRINFNTVYANDCNVNIAFSQINC